jgi:uncharacterized SAM-binding protein YcdF (DUF218 family)
MNSDTRDAARMLWQFHRVNDELHRADMIVGLGSYDLRVAARCADLFKDGFAPGIIFTGAAGNWTKDLFSHSEAEAFGNYAHQLGVPLDKIVLEPFATNIGQNIQYSAALVPEATRVIFVTKPQTQRRCKATAQKQWPLEKIMVTAPTTAFENQPLKHHDERAFICEMVGDLERMRIYAKQGFQTETDIPKAVGDAFRFLVDAGFTDHLPKLI